MKATPSYLIRSSKSEMLLPFRIQDVAQSKNKVLNLHPFNIKR